MPDANLMLHCGARPVTRVELDAVPCPTPEKRWVPVPHGTVLNHALKALTDSGYEVRDMKLGLSRGDARFFGTLVLGTPLASGVQLAVGLRSSYDKSISLQWACGSRVFVCDNMAFRSETVIARKHTVNGVQRYAEAICRAVSQLASYRDQESARIRKMQLTEVTDDFALATLMRLYQDEAILSPRTIGTALKEWREPSFEEFQPRTIWSVYNAVTYALGKKVTSNPQAHAAATIRLGALLSPEAPAPEVLHATAS